VIDKGAKEAIYAGIRDGGALHLAIDAGNDVLLIKKGLWKAAGEAALEGQQESLQVDTVVKKT